MDSVATYWKICWHVARDICFLPREVLHIQRFLAVRCLEYGILDKDLVPECKQVEESQKQPATENKINTYKTVRPSI